MVLCAKYLPSAQNKLKWATEHDTYTVMYVLYEHELKS